MPRPVKLKSVIKTLFSNGFVFVSQNGSHGKFKKKQNSKTRIVVVKMTKKDIPYGTFCSIVDLSGLNKEDFRK